VLPVAARRWVSDRNTAENAVKNTLICEIFSFLK
jgi:hypothetical protein